MKLLKVKLSALFSVAFICNFWSINVLSQSEWWQSTFKTKEGCMVYWMQYEKTIFVDQNIFSTEWDGQCESGKPISGMGTLKVTLKDSTSPGEPGFWVAKTGNIVNGYLDGDFISKNVNGSESRLSYQMGCIPASKNYSGCTSARKINDSSSGSVEPTIGSCKKFSKNGRKNGRFVPC